MLPFGRLWYEQASDAVEYANYSRSYDAVIRVYDAAGNVIETCEREGEFKAWQINVAPVSENVYITMTFSLRMRRTVNSLFNQLLLSSLDLTVPPVQRKIVRRLRTLTQIVRL